MNYQVPPHILDIANSDQCCYCGVCLGICPGLDEKKNLFIEKFDVHGWKLAVQSEDKCLSCTLCRDACPMEQIDYVALAAKRFPKLEQMAHDPLAGYFRSAYVGYSTDEQLRLAGASGGVITAILRWLFMQGKIDGALIVVPGPNGPLDYKGIIANAIDDLYKGSGSHYLPIPAMAAMDQVLYGPFRAVALVGIPCQLDGLRKAAERVKKIDQRVVFQIGSFCGFTSHFRMVDHLYSRLSPSMQPHVQQFLYRRGVWPGNIKVVFNDQSEQIMSGSVRDQISFAGILPACLYCADHFNEFADISAGDAWLEQYMSRKDGGYSTLIVRTERGQNLLDKMVEANQLCLVGHPIGDIVKSQRGPLAFKKRGLGARLFLKRWFTANTPVISGTRLIPWGWLDWIAAALLLLQIRVAKLPIFWKILNRLPTRTIQIIFKPMNILQKRYDIWIRLKKKFLQSSRQSTKVNH